MLGVSPNTLRSWERRFGYPTPLRTAGGHRQFDLAEVEALRQAFEETHNVSSAISIARERGGGPVVARRACAPHCGASRSSRPIASSRRASPCARSSERSRRCCCRRSTALGARAGRGAVGRAGLRLALGNRLACRGQARRSATDARRGRADLRRQRPVRHRRAARPGARAVPAARGRAHADADRRPRRQPPGPRPARAERRDRRAHRAPRLARRAVAHRLPVAPRRRARRRRRLPRRAAERRRRDGSAAGRPARSARATCCSRASTTRDGAHARSPATLPPKRRLCGAERVRRGRYVARADDARARRPAGPSCPGVAAARRVLRAAPAERRPRARGPVGDRLLDARDPDDGRRRARAARPARAAAHVEGQRDRGRHDARGSRPRRPPAAAQRPPRSGVAITSRGSEIVDRLFPEHTERVAQAFAVLDEAEKRSLAQICRKLAA